VQVVLKQVSEDEDEDDDFSRLCRRWNLAEFCRLKKEKRDWANESLLWWHWFASCWVGLIGQFPWGAWAVVWGWIEFGIFLNPVPTDKGVRIKNIVSSTSNQARRSNITLCYIPIGKTVPPARTAFDTGRELWILWGFAVEVSLLYLGAQSNAASKAYFRVQYSMFHEIYNLGMGSLILMIDRSTNMKLDWRSNAVPEEFTNLG